MTIGEYMDSKLEEYNLTSCIKDKNVEYSWVCFDKIENTIDAMNFARFVADCDLVAIRGNKDDSITCWF